MVTYSFSCNSCTATWDKEYKMGKAPDNPQCPACKSKKTTRVFGPALDIWQTDCYKNSHVGGNLGRTRSKKVAK